MLPLGVLDASSNVPILWPPIGEVLRLAGLLPVNPGLIHSHTPEAVRSIVEIGGMRAGQLMVSEGPNSYTFTSSWREG